MAEAALLLVLRTALCLTAASLAALLLRGAAAALRERVLTLALAGVLVLPFATSLMPAWQVSLPSATPGLEEALPVPATGPPPPRSPESVADAQFQAEQAPLPASSARPPLERGPGSAAASWAWPATTPVALSAWVVVSILLLARLAVARVRLAAWTRAARPAGSEWGPLLDRVRRELTLGRAVAARICERVHVPAVAGAWHPVLLLPRDSTSWPEDVRVDVLRHELAHVVRRDGVSLLLSQVACAVHWFNPLVWITAHWAASLREQACDDAVLRLGTKPSAYAGRLIELVRAGLEGDLRGEVLAMARRSNLHDRIARVLDPQVRRSSTGTRATLALAVPALALVGALAALQPVRAEAPPPSPSAPRLAAASEPEPAPISPAAESAAPASVASASRSCWETLDDSSSSIRDEDGVRRWQIRFGGGAPCALDLHAEGKLAFDDDFTDVVRLDSGGSFDLKTWEPGVRRELRLGPSPAGLSREYRVNGSVHAWDAEGRTWLASALLALDRRTAMGIDVRLPRLLASGGVTAVLAETDLIRGDYARDAYYAGLLEARKLSPEERRRLLDQAARRIRSDHYASELLQRVIGQGRIQDPAERAAVVKMIEGMDSDHYRSEAMKPLIGGPLTAEQLSALLKVTASISSDHYKSSLLRALVAGTKLTADQRSIVLDCVRTIESDHYAAETLAELVSRGLVGAGQAPVLSAVLARMSSDHYASVVLALLLDSGAPSDLTIPATLDASTRMSSDHYRSEALRKLLRQAQLSGPQLLRVVELTSGMDSDHYEAETLVAILANPGATEKVREAARAAATKLSRHYAGEVLLAAEARR